MLTSIPQKSSILIVDDEPANLRLLKKILGSDYRLVFAKNGVEAIRLAGEMAPSLVLLDVMMPDMTGFDVCKTLKENPETRLIPVIFVTALDAEHDEALGFEVGGVDYITKPVSGAIVKARVKTHLSLVQSDELRRTRLQIIQRLGKASEFKDNETGMHVVRMSHYSRILGLAYGLNEEEADNLLNAAPMHDIGKIGIPDSIMLKPGKLTNEEFDVMKTHPEIGAEIIGEVDSDLLILAKSVALTHHEKWDGSGYPNRLAGEDIPLEGRIVAVADVFDALTSKRPYKEPWTIEETVDFMKSQSGKHFEPKLITLLEDCLDQILEIKSTWRDE
ncbi:response regulator receiver-modulated signal transduction phosphohydrolase [Oleiphilus messinensis]|uniref:Response regulator receiver-modulated signal transduction phosphohydrolase n=1 Tax=Oleiphilus messinensis TaxID=141451 RepID=A0A1Y0IDG0_9GAMM|nr:HD domain-containing phosphohydrolase [Oleiphilus messinensis]ARU57423.1 response regulator receiver-modulated signal transduction phosphohydrolase [Oleiphilus messinensis]